jgi:hypothetical protein
MMKPIQSRGHSDISNRRPVSAQARMPKSFVAVKENKKPQINHTVKRTPVKQITSPSSAAFSKA